MELKIFENKLKAAHLFFFPNHIFRKSRVNYLDAVSSTLQDSPSPPPFWPSFRLLPQSLSLLPLTIIQKRLVRLENLIHRLRIKPHSRTLARHRNRKRTPLNRQPVQPQPLPIPIGIAQQPRIPSRLRARAVHLNDRPVR